MADAAARRWAPSALTLAAAVSILAVWVLGHPYVGIARDAILYIGRAVADLDPTGVGRQLDFAHDGQSGFTVFRPLAHLVVAGLGPGVGALWLTAAGLAAWIAAAAFLMSRFVRGPMLWAALIAMAAMPADYGDLGVYRYAEALATPRLLAEALSLAGLGLLVRRRRGAALALMLASAALHPLIALPVWAVALVLLGLEDRRWFLVGAAGAAAAIAAAAMGAPVAGRLFETFDPAWRAVVALRTGPVFVSLWAPESWALLACQFATAILAALHAERGLKALLLVVAGVDAGRLLETLALAARPDPRLTVLSGQLSMARGHYEDALADFKQVEAPGPERGRSLEGQGVALSLLGRSDQAFAMLQQAVVEDPTGWRAWNALGGEYDSRRDWVRAEAAYDHALADSGNSPKVLNNRGFSRLLQNRLDDAVSDFVVALEKKPDLAAARTNLRLAMALKGQYDRAVASGASDDRAALLNNAGYAAMLRGDYPKAEDLFTQAIQAKGVFYGRASANLDMTRSLAANSGKAARAGK